MSVVNDWRMPEPGEENTPRNTPEHKESQPQLQPVVTPLPPNFEMDAPYSVPIQGQLDSDKENIVLPSDHNEHIRERFTKVNSKTKDFNPQWLSTFQASLESVAYNEAFVNTVNRPDAEFRQKIDSSVGPLFMGMAKAKIGPNQKLTGESLRLMIRQDLNLGGTYNVPLWHSGFWVRFKAPRRVRNSRSIPSTH